jgi:hypothetical protein
VRVVEKAIGRGLRHDLVESGRVKIAADGQTATFVGGIDQAVEAFGRVRRNRQQPRRQVCADAGDAFDGLGLKLVASTLPRRKSGDRARMEPP